MGNRMLRALGILIGVALGALSTATADYRALRIAVAWADGEYGISDDFLIRVKALGYTHVLANYHFKNMHSCDLNSFGVVETRLRDTFLKVDRFGMRLIPAFNTGSVWAGHWDTCNVAIPVNTGTTYDGVRITMPPFRTKNNDVTDTEYKKVLNCVNRAFNAAKPSMTAPFPNTLEYIHLGHDETGNYKNINGEWLPDYLMIAHYNSDDRKFVDSIRVANTYSWSEAFQALMAQEILDWVNRAKAIPELSTTRLMIWGDMWDPYQNGKAQWGNFGSSTAQTYGVLNLPGLSSANKTLVKSKVILMPWQYEKCYLGIDMTTCNSAHWDYATESTFSNIASAGFDFLFAESITDGDKPISPSRWHQFQELVSVLKNPARQFHVLGFCAANFPETGTPYPQIPNRKTFMTFEYLSYWLGIRPAAVNTAILHNLVVN